MSMNMTNSPLTNNTQPGNAAPANNSGSFLWTFLAMIFAGLIAWGAYMHYHPGQSLGNTVTSIENKTVNNLVDKVKTDMNGASLVNVSGDTE